MKAKRILEWSIFSFLGLVLILCGSLLVYQNSYAGKIYKNVNIAGIDVSGLTKKQAETIVKKKFDILLSQEITFRAGQKTVNSKLNETGLAFDIPRSINEAYAIGRSTHFFPQLYASAQTTVRPLKVSVPLKIDSTQLNLFIAEKLPGLSTQATDAKLIIDNGQVNIQPEEIGQQIDTSDLASKLSNLISKNSTKYEVTLGTVASSPAITSQTLASLKNQAEMLINAPIALVYEDKTYQPSAVEKAKWLTVLTNEGKSSIELNDAAIKTYLTAIAKDFEVPTKDKKINASDNSIVQEGQQGKYLEKDKAVADIKLAFKTPGSVTLTTYTQDYKEVKVFPAEGIDPSKYPGKYIDVDLTRQKLCRIQDNNVIDCFIVSSGKPSMPTPVGTRYIDSKNPKQWSAKYGLWMPWWQSLGGGYGIHELPIWPSGYQEGANHLGTPVSHGCVRLGPGTAQLVYEWTEVGMPVYIHK